MRELIGFPASLGPPTQSDERMACHRSGLQRYSSGHFAFDSHERSEDEMENETEDENEDENENETDYSEENNTGESEDDRVEDDWGSYGEIEAEEHEENGRREVQEDDAEDDRGSTEEDEDDSSTFYQTKRNVSEPSVAGLYLLSPPLPPQTSEVKWVVFQFCGADQGWASFGGDGTYKNSHTWYEASILRPIIRRGKNKSKPIKAEMFPSMRNPQDFQEVLGKHGWELVAYQGKYVWMIHHNITARKEYTQYRVCWVADSPDTVSHRRAMGDGSGFLKTLTASDCIAFWARAEVCFPTYDS